MIRSFEEALGPVFVARHGLDGYAPGRILNDSRKILPGDIFIAIPGTKQDGHDFIPAAIRAGAQCVIHERDLPEYLPKITYIQVSNAHRAYARCYREFCGRPDDVVKLFGVTGTNGKSTTAFLLEHLFRTAGIPCGLISTVEYRDGKIIRPATHTTPDPGVLFPLLAEMRKNGMKTAALELSSHALDQGRAAGAKFRAAIFTNLTGDHLDYHGDMEHYYQTKKRLFAEQLRPDGCAVINIDDSYGRRLVKELPGVRIITYGTGEDADWVISRQTHSSAGAAFRLEGKDHAFDIGSNLIGEYNVRNLAGALLAVLDFGLSPEVINRALAEPLRIPGRLEAFTLSSGAKAYIDYAHTDDALAHVLSTLCRIAEKRVIAVFGAGGDRDRSKRPRMGKAVAEYANLAIVTSDNPRSEKPLAIIDEIVAGMPHYFDYEIIPDRRKAIERAVFLSQPGDLILIAGKGHEEYQEVAGIRHHFSDREILRQLSAAVK